MQGFHGTKKRKINDLKDPWKEYNENIERCRIVLLCGKKMGQPWSHLLKIIARMLFKPLEREKCSKYMFGKKCGCSANGCFRTPSDNWQGWILNCTSIYPEVPAYIYHHVCKTCFRPGGITSKKYYICKKCKIK